MKHKIFHWLLLKTCGLTTSMFDPVLGLSTTFASVLPLTPAANSA